MDQDTKKLEICKKVASQTGEMLAQEVTDPLYADIRKHVEREKIVVAALKRFLQAHAARPAPVLTQGEMVLLQRARASLEGSLCDYELLLQTHAILQDSLRKTQRTAQILQQLIEQEKPKHAI